MKHPRGQSASPSPISPIFLAPRFVSLRKSTGSLRGGRRDGGRMEGRVMIFDGREPAEPGRLAHLRRLLGHLAEGPSVRWWWPSPGEPVEARVRAVVAAQLGVGPEELTPDVSLGDDLAADSLDLVELGFAFEDELGINLPERVLQRIRTYGDLLDAVRLHEGERRAAKPGVENGREPAFVWMRIVPAPGQASGGLLRGGWLTPYVAETIVDDALRSGPGSRLEISVPANVSDAHLAELRQRFTWLAERGVRVSVRRDG